MCTATRLFHVLCCLWTVVSCSSVHLDVFASSHAARLFPMYDITHTLASSASHNRLSSARSNTRGAQPNFLLEDFSCKFMTFAPPNLRAFLEYAMAIMCICLVCMQSTCPAPASCVPVTPLEHPAPASYFNA